MKIKFFYIVIISLCLTSCIMVFENRQNGDGNVTIENREISAFDKIKIDGVFNVYLTQDEIEKVEVEVDQNLQKYVSINIEGTTLHINIERGIKWGKTTKNNIYVSFKDIEQLKISGVCTVKTRSTIQSDNLKLIMEGVSNSTLELKCNQIDAKISGVGNLELSGEARDFIAKKDGVGNLKAEELKAEIVHLNNSGVGSAHVYASQELHLKNSGVGSIYYSGDAVIKSVESTGIGKISKK